MRSKQIRFKMFALLVLPGLAACGTHSGSGAPLAPVQSPSLPELQFSAGFGLRVSCAKGIDANPSWKSKSRDDITAWLSGYGVQLVQPNMDLVYLAQFAAEFERIPEVFRRKAFAASGTVHLFTGHGVTDDPTWNMADAHTFDGRSWADVPGAGGAPFMNTQGAGAPTRFVINRLYEGHGSVNLVLHEFAHSLDSIHKFQEYSDTAEWLAIAQKSSGFRDAIGSQCASYCTDHPGEALAEAFALYFSCDGTRNWLSQLAPDAAAWYANFSNLL